MSRPPASAALTVLGDVTHTVTPVGGSPILTLVIVHSPELTPDGLAQLDGGAAVARRVHLGIPRAAVPSLPIGSVTEGPVAPGGPARRFTVEQVRDHDPDFWRVSVTDEGPA